MIGKKQTKEPQAAKTTDQDSPELAGQPSLPTPGQAEGDRATVEEDLQQKVRSQRSAGLQRGSQRESQRVSQRGSQGGSHEA